MKFHLNELIILIFFYINFNLYIDVIIWNNNYKNNYLFTK